MAASGCWWRRTATSLRALVMVLDRLTPETIPNMELATGVPLVYRLKPDSTVASKEILTA